MRLPDLRQANKIGFWLCFSAIAFSAYLQHYDALSPCPLCIAQRLMIGLLGLGFLFGWLHLYQGIGRFLHGASIVLLALIGIMFAGRQLWLQQLPADQVPPCGPSLAYIIEHLPFQEILKAVFQGAAECSAVTWKMLGITIPGWSMILFILFGALGIWEIMRADEK